MVIVIQKDQVKVGGIAKFLATKLAVGDDRKARCIAVPVANLLPCAGHRER